MSRSIVLATLRVLRQTVEPFLERGAFPIYPVIRMLTALALLTSGGAIMYVTIVGIKPIAVDFGATRGASSLTYTFLMAGYGTGGILMGLLSDRVGILLPALFGCAALAIGFWTAASATDFTTFQVDRKSTRLNSSHSQQSRMPSSA